MKRRAVLGGLAGLSGTTLLAGCALFAPSEATSPTNTRTPLSDTGPRPLDDSERQTPYRDSNPELNLYRPRAIRVENRTRRNRYVTVAVDEGDEMVALRNATVLAGRTISHTALVAKRGVYTVTVDTDAGTAVVREFVVSEGVSDLDVVIRRRSITTRQDAYCWPDCRLVSTGGFVADFPRPETSVRWRGFGEVLVRNVDMRRKHVRVRLWSNDDGQRRERLLDYRYRVPAGMRLVLPLVSESGRYVLAVSADARTLRRVWHVPEESVAEFEIGADVSQVCDAISNRSSQVYGPFRFSAIVNDDDVTHHVFVSIHHRGSVALDELYVVEPGEVVTVGFETPSLTTIELVARTGAGQGLVGTWTHCPPAGALVLTIDEHGRLRTYSDRQGLVGA